MRKILPVLLLGMAISASGCGESVDSDTGPVQESTRGDVRDDAAAEGVQGGVPSAGHDEHTHSGASHEAMTLREIMQRLEREMAGFSHALWVEDYASMQASARAIADHPHIAPEEEERIKRTLGPEMAEFEELDETVHEASSRLVSAAERRDLSAILQELNEVQTGCVACHTRLRDRIRAD